MTKLVRLRKEQICIEIEDASCRIDLRDHVDQDAAFSAEARRECDLAAELIDGPTQHCLRLCTFEFLCQRQYFVIRNVQSGCNSHDLCCYQRGNLLFCFFTEIFSVPLKLVVQSHTLADHDYSRCAETFSIDDIGDIRQRADNRLLCFISTPVNHCDRRIRCTS